MANIDISKPLIECLKQFKGAPAGGDLNSRREALEEDFALLAKKLLYGGHLVLRDDKGDEILKIELRSVEFYYHEEKENLGKTEADRIFDWIMYHRNTKNNKKKPAYKTGFLNAHVSGIDITFEDNDNLDNPKYRASALIRSFYVFKDGKSIIQDKNGNDAAEDHPTKLYDYLFMEVPITAGFSVKWENNGIKDFSNLALFSAQRINVYQYDSNGTKDKTKIDDRRWAFSKEKYKIKHNNNKKDEFKKYNVIQTV